MTAATIDNELYGADPEMVAMFTDNARELVDLIDADLMHIEQSPDSVEHDMLDRLFRNMHTIKGESGFVSLENIGRLTHALEDILDRLRNDELTPTPDVTDGLITGVGRLRGLIETVENSDQEDIADDVDRLKSLLDACETEPEEPVPTASAAPVQEKPARATTPGNESKPRPQTETAPVLIIDDERMVAKLACRALQKAGIDSDSVLTAQEAIIAMQRNLYRVVVCDLHLPDMNGDEVIPRLKAISPLTQVIMLTGDASLGTVLRCLEAGALDFIQKSQDYSELAMQVSEALERAARWKPLMTSRL